MTYMSHSDACCYGNVFRKRFSEMFLPTVRRHTSDKVSLVMDNASSHGAEGLQYPRQQVTLIRVPPSCTARYQPVDCGLIAVLKVRLRYDMLSRIIKLFQKDSLREAATGMISGTKGIDEGHDPHVLDVAETMLQIWNAVNQCTVSRCWIKSNVLPLSVERDVSTRFGKPDSKRHLRLLLHPCPLQSGMRLMHSQML